MFTLVTGAPGSAKTSHSLLRFKDVTDRPIYYRGIKELKLPWHELTDEQAKNWHEEVPEGAIVILDEAQQLFPVRPSSKAVPAGLTALETHRHSGWDVVFITQEPTLLDSHARKVANEQYHYERPFGAPYSVEFHSGVGFVSPQNRSALRACAKKHRKLPKEVFGLYKSAEIHTHKFRPPKLLYAFPVVIALTAWAFYTYFSGLAGDKDSAASESEVAVMASAPGAITTAWGGEASSWAELTRPDIAGLPYTAPLYRARAQEPITVPVVHGCMAFENDQSDCRCYTQQGTRIADMPHAMCLRVLRDGMFNHLASSDRGPSRKADQSERYAPEED